MLERKRIFTKGEKKIVNRFLSLEVPNKLGFYYPSQKIQSLFKLNGKSNLRTEKQKKG